MHVELWHFVQERFICLGSVLTPTSAQLLQPMSSASNNNAAKPANNVNNNRNTQLGATWTNSGNLNIDLDNLLISKPKTGPSPSMNQLASNPTSPVNQGRPIQPPVMSPVGFGYGQQPNQPTFMANFKWFWRV